MKKKFKQIKNIKGNSRITKNMQCNQLKLGGRKKEWNVEISRIIHISS